MDATGFLKIETPTVTEPWRKVLLDAADYTEAHGWHQGGYGDHGAPRCVSGAAMSMAGMDGWQMVLGLWEKRYGCSPCTWNDAPGRTAAEVCEAMRQCARS